MFFYKECERTQRSKRSFIKNAKERLPNPAQKYLFRAFSYLCEEDASDNRLLLWWMLPSLRNPVPVILLGTKMWFFFSHGLAKIIFIFVEKLQFVSPFRDINFNILLLLIISYVPILILQKCIYRVL